MHKARYGSNAGRFSGSAGFAVAWGGEPIPSGLLVRLEDSANPTFLETVRITEILARFKRAIISEQPFPEYPGPFLIRENIEILKLHKDQILEARRMLGRAFFDYPAMVFANPDAARRRRGVVTLYSAILWDAFLYHEVYTNENVTGIAAWLPPGVPLPTLSREMRAGFLGLPFTFGWTAFRRLMAIDTCARRLHHRYASEPHWFLATLGVDPAHQGKGIGSAILQPVLNQADQDRTPCYLETHRPENVRLYERHGFQIAELNQSPNLLPIWSMLRKPR